MPRYRVFLLNESRVARYRDRAPQDGPIEPDPAQYDEAGEIEAPGPYEAWNLLREVEPPHDAARPFGVGDLLEESDSHELTICNYWGFDRASWRNVTSAEGVALEGDPTRQEALAETSR